MGTDPDTSTVGPYSWPESFLDALLCGPGTPNAPLIVSPQLYAALRARFEELDGQNPCNRKAVDR